MDVIGCSRYGKVFLFFLMDKNKNIKVVMRGEKDKEFLVFSFYVLIRFGIEFL